ncbi:MAG TPA: 30S ribosomal protein S9 [Fervidicoccus fontis]|uniref:30S ribosomal protein S9 n=1 Tax=Fervidicoccus fontis TaxID=683846 RepID=A0A2J6N3Z5_9CREN|nr:MAG: 30S ribosomal protein S9 [Fervidicoccus fontis]HEW63659.1 30S ribosomal protein S9 [Fervidicoccus fontis]
MERCYRLKVVLSVGKRKSAIAKVVIKPGKGRVLVNEMPIELHPVELFRNKIVEVLKLLGKDHREQVDIIASVNGGGFMAQADATRTAIARGLVKYFESERLKTIFQEYDRVLLAGDPRRTEPEKYMRYSARRRWQKSYR